MCLGSWLRKITAGVGGKSGFLTWERENVRAANDANGIECVTDLSMSSQTHPDRSLEFLNISQLFTARRLAHLPCSYVSKGGDPVVRLPKSVAVVERRNSLFSFASIPATRRRLERVVFRYQCRTIWIFLGFLFEYWILVEVEHFRLSWVRCILNHQRITRKQDEGAMIFQAVWNVIGIVSGNGLGSGSKM